VAGGWYAASLEPFLGAFGDGLLVLWHDDIATDPVGVYDAALRHVGASPGFQPSELSKVIFSNRRGKAARRYELTHADQVDMWEYFRDDVARLEQLLDVDLSRWEPREESSSRGTAPALADARSRWRGRRREPT